MLKELLRSHFWVFTMSFLFSTSYLMAYMTTEAVRMWLPSSSQYRLPRSVKKTSANLEGKLQAQFALLNKSNLFDPDQKSIVPRKEPKKVAKKKVKAIKAVTCDPKASYSASNLPLQLKGTSIASDPSYSVAAVYDARERKIVMVRAGDNYKGIEICGIEQEEKLKTVKVLEDGEEVSKKVKVMMFYVKLDRGQGKYEYLESGRPPGNGRGKYINNMYKQYRNLRNTKIDLSDIKKVKGGRFSVSRKLIQTLTNRLDWVGAQAAIVPYFSKGKPVGFKIRHIRKNSLYTKLGIKNGDVIKRINGYEFTSPQKALEAYSNLMSAGNLSVEVVRRGKAKNLSYEIKE